MFTDQGKEAPARLTRIVYDVGDSAPLSTVPQRTVADLRTARVASEMAIRGSGARGGLCEDSREPGDCRYLRHGGVHHRNGKLDQDLMTTSPASGLTAGFPAVRSASAPGIEVELDKLKKEHSACVNCSSASTESGKRNIQQLDVRIKQLEARLSVNATGATRAIDSIVASTARPGSIDLYA
jgi:hypothetical protein